MCFFNLVEKNHAVRMSSDLLGKLTSLIITDIPRRRSDQFGYAVLFHILRHIHSDHILFRSEHSLSKSLGQLRLTDAGRAEEQEGSSRPHGVL